MEKVKIKMFIIKKRITENIAAAESLKELIEIFGKFPKSIGPNLIKEAMDAMDEITKSYQNLYKELDTIRNDLLKERESHDQTR